MSEKPEKLRPIIRVLVTLAMVAVGILHFVNPDPFVRIVPEELPAPKVLVLVSGVFEIALGLGLMVPRVRRLAGFGLVALFVAVFPANINMAIRHIQLNPASPTPDWFAWARLPFQLVFILIALYVSRAPRTPAGTTEKQASR